MAAIVLVALFGGADAWAYLAESRALRRYVDADNSLFGSAVRVETISEARQRLREQQASLAESVEHWERTRNIVIIPILPWHRSHRRAKATLDEAAGLADGGSALLLEHWRLVVQAYEQGSLNVCLDMDFTGAGRFDVRCRRTGDVPNANIMNKAMAKVEDARIIDARYAILMERFRSLL